MRSQPAVGRATTTPDVARYTMLTAGIGFVLTVWTAVAYQKDAANTGLVQRGLIIVYWSWIVALAIHLVADGPQP